MDWTLIDPILIKEGVLWARYHYRKQSGAEFYEAIKAIDKRRAELQAQGLIPPDPPIEDPWEVCFQRLEAMTQPVKVIEAFWDGDTVNDWFLHIAAITPGASAEHPGFTSTHLGTVYFPHVREEGWMVYVQRLLNELAARVGAEVHLPVWPPNDRAPRWWAQ